jgi:hypothetical protein
LLGSRRTGRGMSLSCCVDAKGCLEISPQATEIDYPCAFKLIMTRGNEIFDVDFVGEDIGMDIGEV